MLAPGWLLLAHVGVLGVWLVLVAAVLLLATHVWIATTVVHRLLVLLILIVVVPSALVLTAVPTMLSVVVRVVIG